MRKEDGRRRARAFTSEARRATPNPLHHFLLPFLLGAATSCSASTSPRASPIPCRTRYEKIGEEREREKSARFSPQSIFAGWLGWEGRHAPPRPPARCLEPGCLALTGATWACTHGPRAECGGRRLALHQAAAPPFHLPFLIISLSFPHSQIKPAPAAPAPWWLHKLTVFPGGAATLATPKASFLGGWLHVQAVVDADARRRAVGVRWRAATRWGGPHPGRLGRKEKWPVCDGFELRPRWSIDLYTPEVTGSFGARARGGGGGGGGEGGGNRSSVSGRASAGGALTPAARLNGTGSSFASLADSAVSARSTLPGSSGGGGAVGASPSPLATADSGSLSSRGNDGASSSRSRPGGGGAAAALELGHCHIRVPRLDLVADADGVARSAARLVAGATLTPARVLVAAPLRAAWGAPRKVRGALGRALGRGGAKGGGSEAGKRLEEAGGEGGGGASAPPLLPPPSSAPPALPPCAASSSLPVPRRYEVRGWPWWDKGAVASAVADAAAGVEAFALAVAAEGRGGGGETGGAGEGVEA